jgi:hypothetical protein
VVGFVDVRIGTRVEVRVEVLLQPSVVKNLKVGGTRPKIPPIPSHILINVDTTKPTKAPF